MNAATDTRKTSPVDCGFLDPVLLVGLMAIMQIGAWTLVPALTHSALPLDVVEGYMLGREWVIATYQHPALPSWILEASRLATGSVRWPAYLISQLFVAATFIFVFLLGRQLLGPKRAAAGTLLLTGITFYAWPTVEFNHNVAQTLFWAAAPWALWSAVQRRSIAWWVLAAALAAGGLYSKLSTLVLLIAMASWMIWDRDARRCFATPGPWIGAAVFVALITPLTLWLVAHDFLPWTYLVSRSAELKGEGAHIFVANIVPNVIGMFIMVAIAGLIGFRLRTGAGDLPVPVERRAISYLAAIAGGPLALAIIGATLSGSALKVAWGSSMFNFAGLLVIALRSQYFNDVALRRIAVCSGVLLTILPLGYAAFVVSRALKASAALRVNWPQAEISKRFVDIWSRETGVPLRIVGGNPWIAGLVGVTAADKPSISSSGEFSPYPWSPWITPERLEREGVLILWNAKATWVAANATAREERFGRRQQSDGEDIVIRYVVVPPKQRQR